MKNGILNVYALLKTIFNSPYHKISPNVRGIAKFDGNSINDNFKRKFMKFGRIYLNLSFCDGIYQGRVNRFGWGKTANNKPEKQSC